MSVVLQNITKNYGTQKALNDVSFEIQKGEIVALLGPNGAGKSTMMKIITCYIPQSGGNAWVNNHNVTSDTLQVRKITGYLPENNPLYTDMYVREYLEFVAGLHQLDNKQKRIREIIEKTGLEREHHKKIASLSKGYRQRVGIAMALIHDPDVLILDEPTSGLDPNQIIEIRNLIKQTGQDKTVLLSTHIMQEVEAVCDRVIIINRGNIVADAPTHELKLHDVSSKIISIEFENEYSWDDLKKVKGVFEVQKEHSRKVKVFVKGDKDIRGDIFRFAAASGWVILSMGFDDQRIENVFRELTV